MTGLARAEPATPEEPVAPSASPPPAEAAQTFSRFVPMTQNGILRSTVFGVEMTAVLPERNLDGVAALGPAWVRRNGLLWKDVESIEGRGYVWTRPNTVALEREMIAASERGLQLILVVRGSPRWATAPYTADCGPINPAKYARFAAFLAAAVERYSRPPFNVRYWELGNEPDAPVGADSVYGCWGIPSDPYYGGRAYGTMLKAVYPTVKAANPAVQIITGGILLEKADLPVAKFTEGVLVAGAGGSFDILGYHSYCMFDPKNPDGHDVYFRSCATDWKLTFLNDLKRRYGIISKPMLVTEAGLLCSTVVAGCREYQAEYVPRSYARLARDGILGGTWYLYDSDSFNNSALVEPTNPGAARPAFRAMQHAAAMFGGAAYLGPLAGQPSGVEGYRFERSGTFVTIVWSNKAQAASIPVPATATVSCTGREGQPIACANIGGAVTLTAGPSTIYVIAR